MVDAETFLLRAVDKLKVVKLGSNSAIDRNRIASMLVPRVHEESVAMQLRFATNFLTLEHDRFSCGFGFGW